MTHQALIPHRDTPAPGWQVEASAVRRGGAGLVLRYRVMGAIAGLRLPPATASGATPGRAGGLWRHTCFEAFIGARGGAYHEFNLAPSGEWAAYRFAAYREGRTEAALVRPPHIQTASRARSYDLNAALDLTGLSLAEDAPWRIGLSAVLEDSEGRLLALGARPSAGQAGLSSFRLLCL